MTWVRIESGFFRHRKVLDLPIAAKLLFIGGLCYSAENGTDGHISRSALRVLAAELDVKPTAARALEDAGLWHKQADGHDIHDYLAYQPSAEQERQRRQEHADRMKEWRERKTKSRDAARDTSHTASRDSGRDASRDTERALSPNPNPNPVTKSSSSEPCDDPPLAEEEEEDDAMREARRRLRQRVGEPVTNVQGWLERVAANVRLEPKQQVKAQPAPPTCPTCNDLALAEPCPDCGRNAA